MRTIRELDEVEIRVLGSLLEKEQATPDYYPLTINALLAATNQKSNRDPVTALTETEVVEALDRLRHDVLAWRSDGARVERWSQSISRRLELDPEMKAVLTVLMLRGPQTPGELRSRTARLHAFDELREVETTLERLAEGDAPLVVELPRAPGQKESRWAHRLGAEPDVRPAEASTAAPVAAAVARPAPTPDPGLAARLDRVEARVDELAERLDDLVHRLGA